MRSDQVVDVLRWLDAESIVAWVDGGWGIDALLGEQTRDHSDLDLVIDAAMVTRMRERLCEEGFTVSRDWLPTAIAFEHTDGRFIDLHPLELTADGGGDQIQRDGVTRFHYEAPTSGRIGGRRVLCCSPETQIAAHLGYDPQDDDFADMRAIAARFDLRLPPPYSGSAGREH